jgi:hypothetical protein
MKLQSACFVLGAALALTAPAWAQSKALTPTGTGTPTTSTGTATQTTSTNTGTQTTTTSTGAFQNLSPGNQRIAQSLFNAQHPPTGTTALTLDQVAALKGKEGWGRVFKEMKADGLVQAQFGSGRQRPCANGERGHLGRSGGQPPRLRRR